MSAFDAPDALNDDGTVTFRIAPSTWRRYNVSPDTYQTVNGDSWSDGVIESYSEDTGLELNWDSFEWEHDHAGIVRGFAEVLGDWIAETLQVAGLESLRDVTVIDSWSPAFYNFTSDGFELELTCDPAELRSLTEGFDVDEWGARHYASVDGFASFVPSRLTDPTWRADYDGAFRVESLLASADPYGEREWIVALLEAEWEVYDRHTTVTLREVEYLESGYTLADLEEWAATLSPVTEGQLPLL